MLCVALSLQQRLWTGCGKWHRALFASYLLGKEKEMLHDGPMSEIESKRKLSVSQHEHFFGFIFLADVANILLFTGYYRFRRAFFPSSRFIFRFAFVARYLNAQTTWCCLICALCSLIEDFVFGFSQFPCAFVLSEWPLSNDVENIFFFINEFSHSYSNDERVVQTATAECDQWRLPKQFGRDSNDRPPWLDIYAAKREHDEKMFRTVGILQSLEEIKMFVIHRLLMFLSFCLFRPALRLISSHLPCRKYG